MESLRLLQLHVLNLVLIQPEDLQAFQVHQGLELDLILTQVNLDQILEVA